MKLQLYNHFTNTLIFAVIASTIFMLYSIKTHRITSCLTVSARSGPALMGVYRVPFTDRSPGFVDRIGASCGWTMRSGTYYFPL